MNKRNLWKNEVMTDKLVQSYVGFALSVIFSEKAAGKLNEIRQVLHQVWNRFECTITQTWNWSYSYWRK